MRFFGKTPKESNVYNKCPRRKRELHMEFNDHDKISRPAMRNCEDVYSIDAIAMCDTFLFQLAPDEWNS
jgi:hypothetical protein